jgi:AcrR family transcriptional regulator
VRGKRQRLPAEERRVQLLDAARGVFLAEGMAGARTRRIAEVAGVNEALLYQHFSSKEEIFDEAVVKPLHDIVAKVIEVGGVLPTYDPEGRAQHDLTEQYVGDLLRTFIEVAPLLGVVLFSDRSTGERFYADAIRPLAAAISGVVRDAFPTWSHREFDPELVTLSVIGTCISLSLEHHFAGRAVDVDGTARQLTDMLFYGLLDPIDPPTDTAANPRRRAAGPDQTRR